MVTTIFNCNIPTDFQLTRDQKSCQRFSSTTTEYEIQGPYFDLHIMPVEHIATQQGETFLEQFIVWSEGFKTQVIDSETTTFKDYKTYIVYTKTDAVFQKQHFKINYFNACIILDETWCLTYQFVYETKVEAIYKDLAENTFKSIEVLGNTEDWQQAHLDDAMQTQKELQAQMTETESDPPITIAPFVIPENGQDVCKIGRYTFELVNDGCNWNAYEFQKKLSVEIRAKTTEIAKAKKQQLLEFAYDLAEGEIQFSIDFSNIYQQGVPTGEFTIEESKSKSTTYISFNTQGIDRLDFYGTVTLQNGWIGINGVLKKSYQAKPFFTVTVYKQLPTQHIDWSLYRFTLEEALQIQPEVVQYLSINEYHKQTFPKALFAFKNLKHLTIQSRIDNSNIKNLKEIPEEIGILQKLTELSICNTSIDKLPESLGKLRQLEQLHLPSNGLKSLPASIGVLPKLKYLWLQHNQLTELPTVINLPELTSADFNNNQLATLPESLAKQPKLSRLSLENNPLKFLPQAFNDIATIELNIDDKRRLLNFDYQGADGKGMSAWDNSVYFAKYSEQYRKVLLAAINNTVLEKYSVPLEKLALKAVCINTTDADDYQEIGNTRFGGLPDLPQGHDYPQWHYEYNNEQEDYHYIFIAQLNCQELAPYQDYLPRTGILYFYLEDEESFGCKVVYHEDSEHLQSAKHLADNDINIFDANEPYLPFKASFSPFVALPSFYADEYWYQLADAPELEVIEDYDHEDNEAFSEDVIDELSKALGKQGFQPDWNSSYCADSHHSINDYVFTQHESPQEQAAQKLKGNPEDWLVLLKVESDNNCGFCFWDAGELFFVIHKSDLEKGDFSNVYASIETS